MRYPYTLPPLPYAYDAMEPYIDAKTMELHHDGHFRKYVDNLNAALKDYPQLWKWELEDLIRMSYRLPVSVRQTVWNNAGGVYNHTFFFGNLQNSREPLRAGPLTDAIIKTFGSFAAFMDAYHRAAAGVFGSGYAWLVRDNNSNVLKIMTTTNQDTPLVYNVVPLVCIDVWEHAYYLKHRYDRAAYITDFTRIINWPAADYAFGIRG